MAEFGDMLSELRHDRNLTQAELALEIYVTPGTISNYESNVHYPDVEKLKQLADFFNVTTDYLLGRSKCSLSPAILEQEISDGRSWSEIIKDVQSLSPSRQRTLLLMLNDMKTATIIETLKKEKDL
jgi:transcriptional regulator with XRE-family HTH domain